MSLSFRRKLLLLFLTLGLWCGLSLRFRDGGPNESEDYLTRLPRVSPSPPPTPGPPLKPRVHWVGFLTTTSDVIKYHIGTVACGNRVQEAVVLLKSAVALTSAGAIIFYIFTERNQIGLFEEELNSWPAAVLDRLEYRLYEATYPKEMKTWKGKFRACASQRLLFPMLLTDVDALLYLDADTLLLSPLSALWRHFSRFNATNMVALVNEHETKAISWYHHNSKIPFFRPFGLNSGVTLMNLTRLRAVRFTEVILRYEKRFGKNMPWFDQDMFNIFLHFNQERYYRLNCSANYRGDHCWSRRKFPASGCKEADEKGVLVAHGNKRTFFRFPIFKTLYSVFREYKLKNETNNEAVLQVLKTKLQGKSSPCGDSAKLFLQNIVVKGLKVDSTRNKTTQIVKCLKVDSTRNKTTQIVKGLKVDSTRNKTTQKPPK